MLVEEFVNMEWCVQFKEQIISEDSTSLILPCLWEVFTQQYTVNF
jgi:hypothetical protein